MSTKISGNSPVAASFLTHTDRTADSVRTPPATSTTPANSSTDHFDSTTRPPSLLGQALKRLDHDTLSKRKFSALCQEPSNLQGLSPREGQRAIELLAKGYTSSSDEQGIVNLLSAMTPHVRGESLRLLEGGGDKITIDHLLNDDIDSKKLRRQATTLIDEARPFMTSGERTIISDVDDTVKPWKDKTVDGAVFPGARALYKALDLGINGNGTPGDVHFVTARDGIVVNAKKDIQNTGIETNSIRYGDALSGMLSLLGYNKGVEERKVKNITEMLNRNPSSEAVLLGDSTQADPQVFERILESHPERVEFAMIHRVSGFPLPPEIEANDKFLIFDTYADAAQELHKRGIISESQLQEVLTDQ